MTRVPLADPTQLSDWQREQYTRFPSNLTRVLLLLDQRTAGQLPAMANALRTSPLESSLREAIILRIAASQESEYERFQHLGQAEKVGWSDTQVAEIEHANDGQLRETAGASASLPPQLYPVLRFVDAVIAAPQVADDVFGDVRAVLTDQQLVTVIVLIGHYMTVARLMGVLEVALDDAPDSWAHEH